MGGPGGPPLQISLAYIITIYLYITRYAIARYVCKAQDYILLGNVLDNKVYMQHRTERKVLRIQNFNYASSGYYFITFVTQNRMRLFGSICNHKLVLSDAGKMVHNEFFSLGNRHLGVHIDTFVVMPDHVHAIVRLNHDVGAGISLSAVVKIIKTYTHKTYVYGMQIYNWQPFSKRLWHRGYFERIIRSDLQLTRTRKYIINNPNKWLEKYDR